MKVLIITTVRTGGSYLFESLALRYSIRNTYFEPDFFPEITNKLLVKMHVGLVDTDELILYSKKFDHVIILDRRSKLDQAKSLSILRSGKAGGSKSEYTVDKYDEVDVNIKVQELKKISNILSNISKKLVKDIYYYEDIYYNKKVIDGLEFKPDTNKRLLKVRTNTIL